MDWNKLLSNKRIKQSKIADIRNEYESDYGRIIFSPALRRMHDKTQVFPLTTDDNIHSRLTHSNEVMSLGYTFGLKLSKSELLQSRTGKTELELLRIFPILLQGVCLVHDIGNAPFGHFGETIVSDYFKRKDEEEHANFYNLTEREKKDFFHYDGNAQGLRVLTKLQYLDNPFGLNLTYATLASYLKYPNFQEINSEAERRLKSEGKLLSKRIEKSKHGVFASEEHYFSMIIEECGLRLNDRTLRHPLCYLMEAADSIAYLCMDMEDGFNKGLFDIQYVGECFGKNESAIAKKIASTCGDPFLTPNAKIVNIRISLIRYFVDLAFRNFEENLEKIELGEYNMELIREDSDKVYKVLESFCKEKIFKSREINYLESTGHSVFIGLLDFYIEFLFNPNPKYVQRAKNLISKSVISCAIEENLVEIGDRKLEKLIASLTMDIERFAGNADYIAEKRKEQDMLSTKHKRFSEIAKDYEKMFKRQFFEVFEEAELVELRTMRKELYEIAEPDFEDLNDYYKFRIILDFISGMTDQYALDHYQKISGQKIS
ncbi:dGTPase [Filimonas lacunae]|uniref:dGTPase n=1 Tax=Filimonas lacunae TaxID=477680 RepID=A0A173MRI9_9BACT|nr:dNTP triphosphohydrolase [Filimonas lacunae]BAV10049.1 deoxyguanosinetriphosphate triphosphohydrolase [Filimonas lacunae]SIS83175.1 dGTPase [Filimonas lacunae]